MPFVKNKDGNLKQVTDFVAANSQLLKKYGFTAIPPASPKAQTTRKTNKRNRKSCCN